MNSSLKHITQLLPDFEDLQRLADELQKLGLQRAKLEHSIKERETKIFQICSSDTEYFQNGKPPSMSFIENTYKYTGISGELLPVREELIQVEASLERLRLQYAIFKNLFDVWRTLSANERLTTLE